MSKLFGWLPRTRWKRWLVLTAIAGFLCFLFLLALIVTGVILWQNPKVQGWVMVRILRHQSHEPVVLPPMARLSPEEAVLLCTNGATTLQSAGELFRPTCVWDVQLKFTSNQWARLGPNIIPPVVGMMRPDGGIILRNAQASRNGLAGVLGIDLPWSEADVDFGGTAFPDVGARFKGNGTFVNSQRTYKRPFKIELNKHAKQQELAGRAVLNLHNLTADASCLKDTLAYELFRDAGVPASRTAFARVRLSVESRFAEGLLGLYVLVENPDAAWAREQFGREGVALFKPVTYELFKDLGEDWTAYEGIYDPKTKVKARQTERLIALCKLVTHASEREFAGHIAEFIDVEEFSRFLACQVLLSNYDGPLSNGQNFLLYLDPQNARFGFIPWDLDHSWGEFPFVGSLQQRERASIWHPWVGKNRFLERMFAVQAVRDCYRRELERIRATLFLPERLSRRLDELAPVVRPFIEEESRGRLARFEREVGLPRARNHPANGGQPQRPSYCLKGFFAARAESVSQQLAGNDEGIIIGRR